MWFEVCGRGGVLGNDRTVGPAAVVVVAGVAEVLAVDETWRDEEATAAEVEDVAGKPELEAALAIPRMAEDAGRDIVQDS